MKTEISHHSDIRILSIDGDIDMHTSPALRSELMNLVEKGVPQVVIDFSKVSYIDSSGIATFVEGLKGMKSYGGKLKFAGIPEGIMEIFTFSKLDKVFDIYGSREDALRG